MHKAVDYTLEILETNHIEYSYEQVLDTLWLYSVINCKTKTSNSLNHSIEQENNQHEQETQINKNEEDRHKNTILEIEEEQDNNNKLYIQSSDLANESKNPRLPKGEYFRTPTHKQFDKFNNFAKAFVFLKKMVDCVNEYIFDEDKTIENIANTHTWSIILKPKKELKYSLNVIIEQSKTTEIYTELITDFLKALERFNVFKNINVYYINQKYNFKLSKDKKFSSFKSLSILKSSQKRNFTFILSDCVTSAWGLATGYNFLKDLEDVTPFVIINLLPQRVWKRTQLYKSKEFRITHKNGYLNRSLISGENIPENFTDYIKVPILSLEYLPFKNWTKVMAGYKNNWLYGALLEAEFYNIQANAVSMPSEISTEQLIANFENYLSPLAKKLAIYLSSVPMTMDIIKIVQKENLKEANYTHVAEVFLSGLLKKSQYTTKSGDIVYEYKEGIKEILFKRLTLHKKIEILKHNSSFISNNIGSNINFQALLKNPNLEQGIELTDSDRPFAQILIDLFEEMGGEYIKLAKDLEDSLTKEEIINQENIKAIIPTSKRFMMGSTEGYPNEKPVHEVIINYDFEIAKYPVTFEEYDLFCEDTGREKPDDEGWGRGRRPVINVSWHDAKVYCEWLSEKIGETYRLPTEAEREFACRAGTTTTWSFGDDEKELGKYAWYNENSDGKTHPVGEKLPNPWGLYDMHGNVWEWCEDDWEDNYDDVPRDGSPNINKNLEKKCRRGGSWSAFAVHTGSGIRGLRDINNLNNNVGFRLLRILPADEKIASITVKSKNKNKVPKQLTPEPSFTKTLNILGVDDYLDKIDTSLQKDNFLAIYGSSGTGKTVLVTKYLYERKDSFDYFAYVTVKNSKQFMAEIFSAFSKTFLLPDSNNDIENILVKKLNDLEGNKLLVINFESEIGTKAINLFVKKLRNWRVIIVSKEVILDSENYIDLNNLELISFECEKCSAKYLLNCDMLDWETVAGHERRMGIETNYQAYYEIECGNCGNDMSLTFDCWEYPVGAENYRDVQGDGVENIKGDCCWDFHKQYENESDYEEFDYTDNEEQAIEEIKDWFFEHYEDSANSLPYNSKEGGDQWIHGEPVDTENAIRNNFWYRYSEEIIEKAIDEIGRYEQWSPIPQSEKGFQESLGKWAKRKADEDKG